MSEDKKTHSVEEKLDKIKKKRKSRARRPIIIVMAILLVIVMAAGAVFAYLDSMLGLINYDVSGNGDDESGEYIDIDNYSFEDEGDYDTSDFVDPEGDASSDTSGGIGADDPDYVPSDVDDIYKGISDAYKAEVTNILLIGCDTSGGKGSRSDTMIVMSINNVKKRVVLTSILRDCYVSIPGKKNNRINAAHASGGPDLLLKTIKKNFGLEIDSYVRVGFDAFKGAVDAIGGADITVNDINYNWFSKYKADELKGLTKDQCIDGTRVIHLTGKETLAYARNRSYANGDFTRTLHQRDLLMQILENMKNSSLTEVHDLFSAVLPYVTTNMTKEDIKAHIFNAVDYLRYDFVSNRIPTGSTFKFDRIGGASVLVLNIRGNAEALKTAIYD